MIYRFFTTAVILSLFSFSATAQDYNTGIGIRGGFSQGFTVKHFISQEAAIEGILSTRWRGLLITGLYEHHFDIPSVDGLNWYVGGGGHVGFWDADHNPWFSQGDHTVVGLDGIIGIEYNIREFPINFSLDYKPAFNIAGTTGFWGDGGALSIRYLIR